MGLTLMAGARVRPSLIKGELHEPDRGKVKLTDYAETWIAQRPGLRPPDGRAPGPHCLPSTAVR